MIAGLTVADLVRPAGKSRALLYDAGLVLGGSIVIALCTQVAIGYPVPVTGQTFAVLMVGMLLGSRRGALCVLTYLAQGAAGLPVFAHGKAGLVVLFGPTGGYLIGFVAAAYVVGTLAERGWDRRAGTTVLAMVLGNLVLYAGGLLWLACWAHLLGNPLGGGVLAVGLVPFLVGDLLKILLAVALLPTGWKLIHHFGFENSAQML